MTRLSAQVLGVLPLDRWEEDRRVNFEFLAAAFAGARAFRLVLPRAAEEPPFGAALVFDDSDLRDRVRARLIDQDIFPSELWPLEWPLLEGVPEEHRELLRRMFGLPCDGRYAMDDLEQVVGAVSLAVTRV